MIKFFIYQLFTEFKAETEKFLFEFPLLHGEKETSIKKKKKENYNEIGIIDIFVFYL